MFQNVFEVDRRTRLVCHRFITNFYENRLFPWNNSSFISFYRNIYYYFLRQSYCTLSTKTYNFLQNCTLFYKNVTYTKNNSFKIIFPEKIAICTNDFLLSPTIINYSFSTEINHFHFVRTLNLLWLHNNFLQKCATLYKVSYFEWKFNISMNIIHLPSFSDSIYYNFFQNVPFLRSFDFSRFF